MTLLFYGSRSNHCCFNFVIFSVAVNSGESTVTWDVIGEFPIPWDSTGESSGCWNAETSAVDNVLNGGLSKHNTFVVNVNGFALPNNTTSVLYLSKPSFPSYSITTFAVGSPTKGMYEITSKLPPIAISPG